MFMTKNKSDFKSLDDIKNEADPDIEIHSLRRTVSDLKSEIKRMQADYGDLKGYFRDLDSVASDLILEPRPKVYNPKPTKKKVSSPCIAVGHWSDFHYGAVQEAEEIEGINSYSPELCETRMRGWIQNFLNWVEVLRSGYTINECVILDTGDNISGDIHRELSITNAFPTPVQAFKCGILKADLVSMLIPHFSKVRVEFVTPDNHSRLTKKPQAKQAGLNTHNYVVGHVAKLILQNFKDVEFNIYYSSNKAVVVAGRSYLLTHGHDVMGWAGFPYYGIERKVAREALARMWEPDYNKFHKVIMGHWHAPLAHPYYWINGSVSGTDAYDRKQGRKSLPTQCAWIVHPKRGEFNRTEFLLSDR